MSSDSQETVDVGREPSSLDVPRFADAQGTLLDLQDVLGRKWAPVVVYRLLADGPTGFSRLKGDIDGISSKMLSETLTDLESSGLVTRAVVSDRPVRVEYDLTERGAAMDSLVSEMVRWGEAHRDETTGAADTTAGTDRSPHGHPEGN